MERHLDEELEQFNTMLLKQVAFAEEAIHNSVEALKIRDRKLAQQVIDQDVLVNELENEIEEFGIDLIARYQPVASDLRFIIMGMKMNTELERIADLAVNVCYRVFDIAEQAFVKPLIDTPKLADQAKYMLKGAVESFIKKDEVLAKEIILADERANELRNLIMKELIYDYMAEDSSTVTGSVPLLLIARDLERICDHAVALAEDVIYLIKAEMVKHHHEKL